MIYHLEIKEEAADDISGAFTYYEGQKEGLGSEFTSLLEEYLDQITHTPLLYPEGHGHRVAVMGRFPYKIVYGIEGRSVIVFAVFHTSRDPKRLNR